MSGNILIIDGTAATRIVVQAALSRSGYEAFSVPDIDSALSSGWLERADVAILGGLPSGAAARRRIAQLRTAMPETSDLPVLALSSADLITRIDALQSGADDVISMPIHEGLLRARIRSMLRVRTLARDLRPHLDTSIALGFAEDGPDGFMRPKSIAVLKLDGPDDTLHRTIGQLTQAQVHCWPETLLTSLRDLPAAPDVLVIDARTPRSPDQLASIMRTVSELRSTEATRLMMQLVVFEGEQSEQAAMTLDLGADDAIAAKVSAAEIAHRSGLLMKRKLLSDQFRDRVRDGLQSAVTDPLTGLRNRRFALPKMQRMSQQHPLMAVFALDLDHFKQINDSFGHGVGDDILAGVAARLSQVVPEDHLLARLGGEEFVIALPVDSAEEARQFGDRLRSCLCNAPFTSDRCPQDLTITASIGVALCRDPLSSHQDTQRLLDCVDKALYCAKEKGRNRVTLSNTGPLTSFKRELRVATS